MKIKKRIRFVIVKTIGQYINILSYFNPKKALQLSYALFSQPRIGKLTKDNLPNILKNTTSERLKYKDHHFQTYIWEGNENIILLVHGWESNSSRWKKSLSYLQKSGSTIIALDAPAHGQSSGIEFNVPLYTEFINIAVKKYSPNIIIGHSIGGSACVYHQYLFPNSSIKKMVILGAPSDLKTLIINYVQLLSLNTKIFNLLENRYLEIFNFKLEDFSGRIFASNISIPGIIAHDKSDKIVSFDEGKKIASRWKKVRFIETENLGHSMNDADLYKEINEFLFEKE